MGSESKVGQQYLPGTKKMIQSLKEVVNMPEAEIYAVLKECNMDPNEAVQRLLALDTFHEVKSKRERRKEVKDSNDSRPRVLNGTSIRGVRVTGEHISGSCGSTQTSYNELGKAAYKGQNGFAAPSHHPSISHATGRTANQQPSSHSDSLSTSVGSGDAISASVRPSEVNQSAWSSTSSGNFSMADIIKMGINPSKGSHISSETSLHQDAIETNLFNYNVGASQTSGDTAGRNAFHEEWPVIEQPVAATGSSAIQASVETHTMSNSCSNKSNMLRDCHSDNVRVSEVGFSENGSSDHSVSSRQKIVDASHARSYHDDNLSSNSSSYGSHRRTNEKEEVSSATLNMQQLSLGREEASNQRAVVLPNNLQELAADCSHLSFGTYKSGKNASGLQSFQTDLGGAYAGIDASVSGRLDTRNSGYNPDELLGTLYDNGRATIDAKYYDLPVNSQPELIKHDILEVLRHKEVSSLPNFSSDILRASSGLSLAREEPNFRNVPPPQSDMAYSDSRRSDFLESTFQSLRGSDHPYSQLLGTPSMPSRYSAAVSSVNSPTISISEALRPGPFPLPEASSMHPRHLSARSYPQPIYDQLANIIGQPSQSFSRMPAMQQAYVGTGLHQSAAGMEYSFPQYRNGVSVNRPSAATAAGHGSFGTSTNVHGNFLPNSPISNRDYDHVFRSQYNDGNHINPLHQSSRTLSSIADHAYDKVLGQNPQYAGYQQEQARQVPSQMQHYGSMGYPDFYNSQMGMTRTSTSKPQ